MRIAMTGGEGPIGRALQKVLAARAIASRSLLASEPPPDTVIQGEYVVGAETDLATFERLLDGADALIYLGRPIPSPDEEAYREELAAMAALIPAVDRAGIPLHFFSSSTVFTPQTDSPAAPLDEEVPVAPSSLLGMAHLTWEQTLRAWGEHKGLRYVTYRIPTAVPEYLVYSSISARYLRAGFRTGEIFSHAYDDGKRWGMCCVHAEDVARMLAETIGRTDLFGEVFHLAADLWISEHELAEVSYRVLCDFMVPCKWRPPSANIPTGLVGDVWLDNRKAKRALNLNVADSMPRLVTKLRLWVDDFGSTARLRVAKESESSHF